MLYSIENEWETWTFFKYILPHIYRLKLEYVLESIIKAVKVHNIFFTYFILKENIQGYNIITTILLVLFDFLVHISVHKALNYMKECFTNKSI